MRCRPRIGSSAVVVDDEILSVIEVGKALLVVTTSVVDNAVTAEELRVLGKVEEVTPELGKVAWFVLTVVAVVVVGNVVVDTVVGVLVVVVLEVFLSVLAPLLSAIDSEVTGIAILVIVAETPSDATMRVDIDGVKVVVGS